MACNAVSSGYVRADVFEDLLGELLGRLEAQLPVDGLFLALHGAMVAEGDEDASGSVLARARELVGAGTPIVASLDLHANVTDKMIGASDGFGRLSHLPARRFVRKRARLACGCCWISLAAG